MGLGLELGLGSVLVRAVLVIARAEASAYMVFLSGMCWLVWRVLILILPDGDCVLGLGSGSGV